jgi:universal stress protein A
MMKLKRLLLPTDFSESARHAFAYGLSFAGQCEAELFLLHVIEILPAGHTGELFHGVMTKAMDEISGYARTEMARLVAEARSHGRTVHERISPGKAAAEILRVAREDEIDMIVMGTHGRGTLSHVLFGSTTERVVRKAPCPVLICRPLARGAVTD